MPIRMCNVRGCPNKALHRGQCRVHARAREREHARGSAQAIYQSRRWKALKRSVLAAHPQCADCPRPAADVHHIVEIDQGGAPFARSNLVGLCKACHTRRHKGS